MRGYLWLNEIDNETDNGTVYHGAIVQEECVKLCLHPAFIFIAVQ